MIQIYAKLPFPSFHVREDDKLDLLYRVYVYAQSVGLLRIILQWIGPFSLKFYLLSGMKNLGNLYCFVYRFERERGKRPLSEILTKSNKIQT